MGRGACARAWLSTAVETLDECPEGVGKVTPDLPALAPNDNESRVLEEEFGERGPVIFARWVLTPAGLHRVVGDVDLVVIVNMLGEDQRDALQELFAGRGPYGPRPSAVRLFEERLLEICCGLAHSR
jgi:hypothetical protein